MRHVSRITVFSFFLLHIQLCSSRFDICHNHVFLSPFKADKFQMYVNYCKNKPDSTQLILEHAGNYFDVSNSICFYSDTAASCLLRPVTSVFFPVCVCVMTGNPTTAPAGQLHFFLSNQASTENHQVSAPAEGNPPHHTTPHQISVLQQPSPPFLLSWFLCVCLGAADVL